MSVLRGCAVLYFCVCVSAIVGPAGNSTKQPLSQKTDTYLEAYSKSRIEAEKAKQGVVIITAKDGEKKIANRDDSFSGYDYSPSYSSGDSSTFSSSGSSGSGPSNNYLPPSSYGPPVKFESDITYNAPTNTYGAPAPANNYGPPKQTYGPPAQTYGPPAQTYGPPAQAYGPPAPAYGPPIHKPLPPVYGPPKPTYGVPYGAPAWPAFSFLDKLSLKLDILTIAKLMLKFLIFKKIVTMIAVVCMLLVIPKLISFKKDGSSANNDDEDRKFGSNLMELTSVHQLLERAISVYGEKRPACGVPCRLRRVLDDIYEFQPYFRANGANTSTS